MKIWPLLNWTMKIHNFNTPSNKRKRKGIIQKRLIATIFVHWFTCLHSWVGKGWRYLIWDTGPYLFLQLILSHYESMTIRIGTLSLNFHMLFILLSPCNFLKPLQLMFHLFNLHCNRDDIKIGSLLILDSS